MKNKCSVKECRLAYDHPIEKARFILSSAFYNSDEYTKSELINVIVSAIDYIDEWEEMFND